MNLGGEYLIGNQETGIQYNTSFENKNAEYFEVYAGPISTVYGEVFWQGLPVVQLPADIIKRFDNKTISILGYEQDQVIRQDGKPDQSVPIYWAYNHHYVAWIKGKHATMVDLPKGDKNNPKLGHPLLMNAFAINDPNPDSVIPTSQFFSEGNGGESRKSYHGYPKGMAQLIDSPTEFVMTPMQIDTWNRNTSYGEPFVPGPEPTSSQAPRTGPDAIYSGHLECPCTDRIVKTISHTYATQATGTCPTQVETPESCFDAAAKVGESLDTKELLAGGCAALSVPIKNVQCNGMTAMSNLTAATCGDWCCGNAECATWLFKQDQGCYTSPSACDIMPRPNGPGWSGASRLALPVVTANVTLKSSSLPPGCSVVNDGGNTTVYFNQLESSKELCGTTKGAVKLSGSVVSVTTFSLRLDATTDQGEVTITLKGPSNVWYGVGLGATVMADSPNAIIVSGNGTIFEQKLQNQGAGSRLAMSLKIISNEVLSGLRTVVLKRPFKGLTKDHYTFDVTESNLDFINAIGKGVELAYHATRASSTLNLQAEDAPTCICDTGKKGFLSSDKNPNLAQFSKNCREEPYGDLERLKNPTCTIEQYSGGLHCCTSGNILLDKDQNPWPDRKLTYYMKWRF